MTNDELKQLAELISSNVIATTKKVLTIDEVCVVTGLAKSYIYKLTSSHSIPYYKPNSKLVYFDREEIEKWLLTNRVATTAEINESANQYLSNTK